MSPLYVFGADLRLPRVVVASGGPYASADLNVQQFQDSIVIPQQYLKQPLSMVCTNGSQTAPGFDWVRVFLVPGKSDQDYEQSSQPLGRLLVDEKSFLDTSQVYLDMTSQLKSGRNNISVEGAGRPGAVFCWEIRSIGAPELFMAPDESVTAGSWIYLNGSGFSLRADENIVRLGQQRLSVEEASPSLLKVFVPADLAAGSYDLSVAIWSYVSSAVKVQVRAPGK